MQCSLWLCRLWADELRLSEDPLTFCDIEVNETHDEPSWRSQPEQKLLKALIKVKVKTWHVHLEETERHQSINEETCWGTSVLCGAVRISEGHFSISTLLSLLSALSVFVVDSSVSLTIWGHLKTDNFNFKLNFLLFHISQNNHHTLTRLQQVHVQSKLTWQSIIKDLRLTQLQV